MNIEPRWTFIAAGMVVALLVAMPPDATAQTPAQMEYERQQREYRQQQEQQRQEQQRQQQLMNENARRQQEEASRFNAPVGQSAAPAYPGPSPRPASQRQAAPVDVAAGVAAAQWERMGSSLNGESDFYLARSTIRRAGGLVKMWEMIDFKAAAVVDGKRYYSARNLWEYDCKGSRRRLLAATAYAGHAGKGTVVGSESFPPPYPWQPAGHSDGYANHFLKLACAKK